MIQIFLTILGLLITILIALGMKRLLAWFLVISATLIAPNALITWVTLEISARILAPTTTDVSSFVTKIVFVVGATSSFYPLIWGVRFYPSLKHWVSSFPLPTNGAEKSASNDQGGITP